VTGSLELSIEKVKEQNADENKRRLKSRTCITVSLAPKNILEETLSTNVKSRNPAGDF
jgi:hypothetical protein